jgi:hypothetical protein
MTIKRMLNRNNNLPYCYISEHTSWYIDNSMEFHSLEEIKDYCRENVYYPYIRYSGAVYYKFKIIDTNDEVEIICSVTFSDDGFNYVSVVGNF